MNNYVDGWRDGAPEDSGDVRARARRMVFQVNSATGRSISSLSAAYPEMDAEGALTAGQRMQLVGLALHRVNETLLPMPEDTIFGHVDLRCFVERELSRILGREKISARQARKVVKHELVRAAIAAYHEGEPIAKKHVVRAALERYAEETSAVARGSKGGRPRKQGPTE